MRVDFFGIWLKAENEYDSEENIVGQMGNRHIHTIVYSLALWWSEV